MLKQSRSPMWYDAMGTRQHFYEVWLECLVTLLNFCIIVHDMFGLVCMLLHSVSNSLCEMLWSVNVYFSKEQVSCVHSCPFRLLLNCVYILTKQLCWTLWCSQKSRVIFTVDHIFFCKSQVSYFFPWFVVCNVLGKKYFRGRQGQFGDPDEWPGGFVQTLTFFFTYCEALGCTVFKSGERVYQPTSRLNYSTWYKSYVLSEVNGTGALTTAIVQVLLNTLLLKKWTNICLMLADIPRERLVSSSALTLTQLQKVFCHFILYFKYCFFLKTVFLSTSDL